jgi:hypothetical protein
MQSIMTTSDQVSVSACRRVNVPACQLDTTGTPRMPPHLPVALYTDSTLSRAMYSPFCSLTCAIRQRGFHCTSINLAVPTRCLIRSMIVSVPLGSHYIFISTLSPTSVEGASYPPGQYLPF